MSALAGIPSRHARHETWKFVKSQLSSSLATVVDWGLLSGLIGLGVNYLYAAAAGSLAGAITDFSVKRRWVFQARAGKRHHQALRYALVSATSAGFNCLLAYGLVSGLGAAKLPGVITASVAIGFLWNYPMHRLFVFRRQLSSKKEAP